MHNLTSINKLFEEITNSKEYKQWQENHTKASLSHFFCSISSDFKAKSEWEVGFFDQETGKITVFTKIEDVIVQKPADDVFKQPTAGVDELNLNEVTLSVSEAIEACKKNRDELFKEQFGDGFAIVQTFKKTPVWNFSFITKTLKFVNIKIHAKTGSLVDSQDISLIQK